MRWQVIFSCLEDVFTGHHLDLQHAERFYGIQISSGARACPPSPLMYFVEHEFNTAQNAGKFCDANIERFAKWPDVKGHEFEFKIKYKDTFGTAV